MDNEDIKDTTTSVVEDKTGQEAGTPATEQDPLKTELDKFQGKKRTKKEKLLYTRERINEQLKELGVEEPEEEDDKPVTIGMLKDMEAKQATKTALQMADEVSNLTERELLKYHLENTIRSTGNPREDFKLAQGLVNSVKNQQILEETLRKPGASNNSTGAGAPPNKPKESEELSAEELAYTRPPFNMTKEQIIAAREGKQHKFKGL